MDLDKLERLAVDLRSIIAGNGPTEEELARAPLLLNWRVASRPVLALEGLVLDHPLLGAQQITTSQLYWVSDDKSRRELSLASTGFQTPRDSTP